ncbi:hypothetical protein ACQJBY_059665 [Aegilops geniculata]
MNPPSPLLETPSRSGSNSSSPLDPDALLSDTIFICLFDSVWSRSSSCSRPPVPSFHGCAAARGPPYASPRSYGSRLVYPTPPPARPRQIGA